MPRHQAYTQASHEEKLSNDTDSETLQKTAEQLEQTAGLCCWQLRKHLSP